MLEIRQAALADIPRLLGLINAYKGVLEPYPAEFVEIFQLPVLRK
jgi:hypothetical protein